MHYAAQRYFQQIQYGVLEKIQLKVKFYVLVHRCVLQLMFKIVRPSSQGPFLQTRVKTNLPPPHVTEQSP